MEVKRDDLLGLIIKDEDAKYIVRSMIESTDGNGQKHYNLIVDKIKPQDFNISLDKPLYL